MACRTGCTTRDHESFSACLRSAGTRVAYANSAKNMDATAQKKWDAELDSYRSAVSEGIQPASTRTADIVAAKRISDKTGSAFRADL